MVRGLGKTFLGAAALGAVAITAPAVAGSEQRREYHLQEQDLGAALRAIGRTSGRPIMFPSDAVAGMKAPKLEGEFTAEEAVDLLIKGSNLVARNRDGAILIRGRSEPSDAEVAGSAEAEENHKPLSDIVVTGSRIRGAISPSPSIIMTQEEIVRAGQSNLGEALRSLPQNFSGGQNPGVGPGAPVGNSNQTGSSAANLRGLGADATLTLLNGHRLAFGTTDQSVDISAIPLSAVREIEIVADGTSALYGSDAVGGVVNVLLKPDYDGLSLTGRLGTTTDGGNFQQQYSAVGGQRWGNGGFIATYDFGREANVDSGQRDYLRYLPEPYIIYPKTRRNSAVLSGHQDIGDFATAKIDAVYNFRKMNTGSTDSTGGTVFSKAKTKNYDISGTVDIPLSSSWLATLNATYGRENTDTDEVGSRAGVISYESRYLIRSKLSSFEGGVEGPLFALPAGETRVALGAGYRRVAFFNGTGDREAASNIAGSQRVYYAYGELQAPLIGDQTVPSEPFVQFNAAGRFEHYNSFGDVFTPKLGIVTRPVEGFWIKASWGKSFKAPTLNQMYLPVTLINYSPSLFGGSGPSNASVLYGAGGNADLAPERARTWQVSLEARPQAVPGLSARLSYYDILYRDRVATPIQSLQSALSDPNSREYVTLNPSAGQINAFFPAAYSFYNFTATPYDPADVVALIYNRYFNANRQTIRGVDFALDYTHAVEGGTGGLHANLAWIDSSQINGGGSRFDLAGTAFKPARFRARSGISWAGNELTLSTFLNYIGGVKDTRTPTVTHGDSMTTVDVAGQYRIGSSLAMLKGLVVGVSAQNIFNVHPPFLPLLPGQATFPNYDSTNYSALGRIVSITATVDF